MKKKTSLMLSKAAKNVVFALDNIKDKLGG